jgi:hypothetical protein
MILDMTQNNILFTYMRNIYLTDERNWLIAIYKLFLVHMLKIVISKIFF